MMRENEIEIALEMADDIESEDAAVTASRTKVRENKTSATDETIVAYVAPWQNSGSGDNAPQNNGNANTGTVVPGTGITPETETPEVNEPETQEPGQDTEEPEVNEPETETPEVNEPETEEPETEIPEVNEPETEEPETEEPVVEDEYHLVWEEQFDGDSLNMDDWNYEYHEPGWVNAELQEYVDSEENIYLEDGNLIIQAIKTVDENGDAYYTSGRINTQNKHDYMYGRFEVRAKVPSGKGFLPAFWMMPTDENLYGQWPKCGEIDIMEVMGHDLNTSYGTLHFGEPHAQKQGTYHLPEGDFHNEFHTYACEWDPGEFRFYVDGELFYTVNDWFTKKEGYGEVAYPAPYDQPFYMILNVAVGGTWVGYPEDDAIFEDNARMVVDYVRVYAKDSYDTNVTKPENNVTLREPDATGNYVLNSDFAAAESLSDGTDWELLLAGAGAATATISENQLHINSTVAGEYDYSVQIVRANMPLEKGYRYRLSFDASADEERSIITGITAPDLNYSRYLQDTKISVSPEKQAYSFEFDMTSNNDANGRIEFNLGNQGSVAGVHISNVRLEKVGEVEVPDEVKSVLPDGNYVYNGQFQEGAGRLEYWNVESTVEGATVSVTNQNQVRELMANVPANVLALDQVKVVQPDVAITGGKEYVLSFDAYADASKSIQVRVANQCFDVTLTPDRQGFKFSFITEAGLNKSNLEFLLGVAGISYVDNVRIQENGMFINGDFSNGTVGYEVWNDTNASQITYGVDGLNEDNAFTMNIVKTGSEDWHIQLKQNDITLENGKWYQVSFDAKSTIDRKIKFAFQRDGLTHKTESGAEDWTPYCEDSNVQLTSQFTTVTKVFQMTEPTDAETIFSVSMGAVGGQAIDTPHIVTIDNIKLVEVEQPPISGIECGVNQVKPFDAAEGFPWQVTLMQGENTYAVQENRITFSVQNVGEEDWHTQMKQMGLMLENGCKYQMKFYANSTQTRTIRTAVMNGSYNWYAGTDTVLPENQDTEVVVEFVMDKDTDSDVGVFVSMGNLGADISVPSDITLWDFSLVKIQ